MKLQTMISKTIVTTLFYPFLSFSHVAFAVVCQCKMFHGISHPCHVQFLDVIVIAGSEKHHDAYYNYL